MYGIYTKKKKNEQKKEFKTDEIIENETIQVYNKNYHII